MPSKKTKRSQVKYPSLDPLYNTKIRRELLDIDYVDKLSEEEKEWLNKFLEEYVSASFKKSKKGNYSKSNLHKTKKMRKECYKRNNDRNNDLYAITKTQNLLVPIDSAEPEIANPELFEEAIIASIDKKDDE